VHPAEEVAGNVLDRDAEEVLDLRAGDEQRDAVREADHDRPRDEAHGGAESRHSRGDQERAGHHRAHEQARDAVLCHDGADDHDECSGRSANLVARAPEGGDEETDHDCAVDPRLRLQPGRDGKRHGQRECDQPDGDAGHQIQGEHTAGVAAHV
jgi:hypothetical protein